MTRTEKKNNSMLIGQVICLFTLVTATMYFACVSNHETQVGVHKTATKILKASY